MADSHIRSVSKVPGGFSTLLGCSHYETLCNETLRNETLRIVKFYQDSSLTHNKMHQIYPVETET